MVFAETLFGIIFIIYSLLVKKYPNLIAGYNSMTEEEKKKINIDNLFSSLHNSLILIELH